MIRGKLVRLVAAILGAVIAVLLFATPASAHSETVRSDPPNGGMVPVGRTSLTLWFDEEIGSAASSFELRTLEGLELAIRTTVENGANQVKIEVEPLARGPYVLDWHAFSLVDGHASSGTIVFGAGIRPDIVAAQGAGPPPLELLVVRWLDLSALLLAIGALAVSGRVLGAAGAAGSRIRDKVRGIGLLGAWAAVYFGVLTPFLRTRSPGEDASEWFTQAWLTLSETEWGQLWLWREVALIVAGVAMWQWRREHGRSDTTTRVAVGALTVAVLLQSWGGHAAALPTGSTLNAVMSAGHILASGVWAGGLTVLVITLLVRAGAWEGSRSAVLRAFSPLAAASSVVLLATGLYQAGQHVPDLGSLVDTVYGVALSGKFLLVAAALGLAAFNTLVIDSEFANRFGSAIRVRVSAAGPRTLVRAATAEVVVLGIAVLLAAVLTSVPTAREVSMATKPSAPEVANIGGLFLTFESVPEGVGRHRLILKLRSTIKPEPAPVVGVDVIVEHQAGGSEVVALTPVEEGRYEGSTTALEVGRWVGTVRVHREGLPDTVMQATGSVASPSADLSSPLRTVSMTLSGLLLLSVGLLALRRRREPASSEPTVSRRKELSSP